MEINKIIEELNKNNNMILYWSGGKDSTSCIFKLLDKGIFNFDVLFIDTQVEFPEMYKYIEKIELLLKKYNINVYKIHSHKYTWDNVFYRVKQKGKNKGEIYGFPYSIGSWCNDRLKASVFNKLKKELNNKIEVVGYTLNEKSKDRQERISKYLKGELKGFNFPLIDNKMTESDCLNYLSSKQLLNPLYSKFNRTGCWLCPKQPLSSLYVLFKDYPDLWEKLKQYQKDSKVPIKPNKTLFDIENKFIVGKIPKTKKIECFECNMIDKGYIK